MKATSNIWRLETWLGRRAHEAHGQVFLAGRGGGRAGRDRNRAWPSRRCGNGERVAWRVQ